MRALEKSTGKTAKELFKMMEMGQLGAEYILPFTRALRSLSSEGGALEKALKTLRVEENRLINQSKLAGDKIFKSGFSEGLSELYKTISEMLKDAGPQLEKLGDIFGKVFKVIAHGLRVIEPYMKIAIDNFWTLFGAASIARILTMGAALRTAFLPLTIAAAAAEELASWLSDDIIGVAEMATGKQVNLRDMTESTIIKKDGKFFKGDTTPLLNKLENHPLLKSIAEGMSGSGITAPQKMWGAVEGYTDYALGNNILGVNMGGSKADIIRQGNGNNNTAPVIINNTYNNATADEMKRNQQMQSLSGIGVSK